MNRTRILTVCCLVVAALALVCMAMMVVLGDVSSLSIGWFSSSSVGGSTDGMRVQTIETLSGDFEEAKTATYDVDEVERLEVTWMAGDVEVILWDEDQVKITEYAQRPLTSREEMSTSLDSGGGLSVRYISVERLQTCPEKRLEVYLPRSLAEDLGGLEIGTTSGDIKVPALTSEFVNLNASSGKVEAAGIDTESFWADTTSGDITVSDICAESIYCDASSGNIQAADLSGLHISLDTTSGSIRGGPLLAEESVYLDASSGNIELAGLTGESITASASSGKITLTDIAGGHVSSSTGSGKITLGDISAENLYVNTSSGGLAMTGAEIEYAAVDTSSGGVEMEGAFSDIWLDGSSSKVSITSSAVPEALWVSTSSGNVTLTLPAGDELDVYFDSTSGSFNCDIPVRSTRGDGYYISTSSGNLRIEEYK